MMVGIQILINLISHYSTVNNYNVEYLMYRVSAVHNNKHHDHTPYPIDGKAIPDPFVGIDE
jgi:hypothetical protein